ncbi:LemA protein [Pseudomonas duriflava]|uniref:LemA protein n=1 Tax=Pseudomonas duriflava TaxID=459528 RepID=A0A562QAZ1_9PSED|nr:LemA family protein [Pseudomonas duriflava]TWI53879.1 LemA protein [Pseudomonas duriflava]
MKLMLFLAVLAALGFFLVSLYNALVSARNAYRNAFAQIDVQLTRRHDLIPNLVETVKGYMKHERETLEAVVQARSQAVTGLTHAKREPGDMPGMQTLASAENQLSQALGRLMVVSEAYPELKANENMIQLTEELTSTENRVAFARQAYNDAVMMYNNRCETFPSVMIARRYGFTTAHPLEIENISMRAAPRVSLT